MSELDLVPFNFLGLGCKLQMILANIEQPQNG